LTVKCVSADLSGITECPNSHIAFGGCTENFFCEILAHIASGGDLRTPQF
jgi:hypothetical protein